VRASSMAMKALLVLLFAVAVAGRTLPNGLAVGSEESRLKGGTSCMPTILAQLLLAGVYTP
jgi:hypothetical protein